VLEMNELKPRTTTIGAVAMKFCKIYPSLILLLCCLLTSQQTFSACNSNMALTKPDRIYTDHDNGAVTDAETGLMWMKCSLGQSGSTCAGTAIELNWIDALNTAQAANLDAGTLGYNNWRLPNQNELQSLVEYACYNSSINATFFPATMNVEFWSASPSSTEPSLVNTNMRSARTVDFRYGYSGTDTKNNRHLVRLVRTAQPE
jgi:hypothetical protein